MHNATLQLLAAETVKLRSISFDPAFNWFLLLLLCAAVGAMVFYLYREQQKIAPPRLVHWLTGIRLLLILLVLVLLLRPVRQWASTHNTGGTLWVLVDQSLSMNQADRQTTKVDQLRWADSLGYLPADLRTSKLDRIAARVTALRGELQHLESGGDEPLAQNDSSTAAEPFEKKMKDWLDQLADLTSKLQKDPQGPLPAGAEAVKGLREVANSCSNALEEARQHNQPDQANATVPWRTMLNSLSTIARKLTTAADKVDNDFLASSSGNPAVQAAMAKVAGLHRSDFAYAALTNKSSAGLSSLSQVLDAQETRIVTFSGAQQMVTPSEKSPLGEILKNATKPVGSSTDIAGALKYVGDQLSSGDQASIVLVSDGRSNDGGELLEPAHRLATHGARLYTLTVGARQVVSDAAVDSVDAPDWIFKDDTLRASALLRLDGLAGKTCTVEFRRGSELVDTQTITPKTDQSEKVVTFHDKPPEAKLYDYEVAIKPMPEEAVKENNRQSFRVSVKSDKLHALIVEDQPRWEYRYLANYLSRDNRVQLQTVLLEPAKIAEVQKPAPIRASATNTTTTEAQLLPQTKSDWAGFDLIVLGDVPVEFLNADQQQNIAAAVKDRGTTLLVIAGPQNMPGRFAGTPLADLLPVYLNANWTTSALQDHIKSGFRPVIAPSGAKSILSQLGLDPATNADLWAAVPNWYWHSEQTQAKLSADVIWSIADAHKEAADNRVANTDTLAAARQRALLATMSVGLGRVMYLASDATWRLRQVSGQNLHERFWGQFIRWVVGSDLPAGGKLVRFGTNKPRYADGESIHVTARVLKEDLSPLTGKQFKVVARVPGATGAAAGGKILADADMQDSPETPGLYHATIPSPPPGPVELSLAGTDIETLISADTTATSHSLNVEVLADANLELQNINSDHQTMEQLAQAGGGISLDAPYFDILADHIPNLRHDQTTIEQVGLFTDPRDPWTQRAHWGFLLLFVGLITTEWILRKSGGLV